MPPSRVQQHYTKLGTLQHANANDAPGQDRVDNNEQGKSGWNVCEPKDRATQAGRVLSNSWGGSRRCRNRVMGLVK